MTRPESTDTLVRLGADFHRRGWVLGTTEDVPGRVLPVEQRVSPLRFFSPASLTILRWVSERYVSPLAAVIARSHPPRVVSEESVEPTGPTPRERVPEVPSNPDPVRPPMKVPAPVEGLMVISLAPEQGLPTRP